jgi:hypothetical protein
MKPPQFLITVILAGICLLLSLFTWWQGEALTKTATDFEAYRNQASADFAKKQQEINAGNQYSQILFRIVQEIMTVTDTSKPGGQKDDKLRGLPAADGINFKLPETSGSSAASSPTTSSTSH